MEEGWKRTHPGQLQLDSFEGHLKVAGLLSRKLQGHVTMAHSLPDSTVSFLDGTLAWEVVGIAPPGF